MSGRGILQSVLLRIPSIISQVYIPTMTNSMVVVLVVLVAAAVQQVSSHGYASDPPSRSSMWRYGFNTPINYDDNQLWCGGFQVRNTNQNYFLFRHIFVQ